MRRNRLMTTMLLGGALILAACGGGDDADRSADPPDQSADADQESDREGSDGATAISVPQIPGDPSEDGPSALTDMNDPAFPEPLVDPDQIRSGGPPPDGIPPIDDPRFEPASAVTWLDDVEPVLSLEIDGEARAYPLQIMTWHEIVNDTFGSTPVTVTYCPLCNSAVAYIRQVDGRILDFGTSGRLLNSSLVMYDRQTKSLWSHFTGEAVIGMLTGTALEIVPVATVSWEAFRTAHPEGLVLSRETGFARDYGTNPYPGYDDVNQTPFLFSGEFDGRLAAQTRVVVVRGETETIAVVRGDVSDAGIIDITVDGEPVVVLLEPGTASALDTATISEGRDIGAVGVFRPDIDGRALQLERTDGVFRDAESGTTFDILGRAVDGELQGTSMESVEHLDTFWFAIAAFEPDTKIVSS